MKVTGTTGARYHDRVLLTCRQAFVEWGGEHNAAQREREIAALESKNWRGVRVYALRCHGDYGKGPHVQFVPQYLLWGLISLDHWLCPFHTR